MPMEVTNFKNMTAQEARKLATENLRSSENEDYQRILLHIKSAISKGKLECYADYWITDTLRKVLVDDGYIVDRDSSPKNESGTRIRW